jgi:hypothetical protein
MIVHYTIHITEKLPNDKADIVNYGTLEQHRELIEQLNKEALKLIGHNENRINADVFIDIEG